jgi:hypothetical protein
MKSVKKQEEETKIGNLENKQATSRDGNCNTSQHRV